MPVLRVIESFVRPFRKFIFLTTLIIYASFYVRARP
jgi:hypothetical protein